MRFRPTTITGAYLVEVEPVLDERGFFARTWCAREFAEQGLDAELTQCSASFSPRRGTLRGMHYQRPPHAEVKLVRCTRGALFDVAVDLRPDSATYLAWAGAELTAENHAAFYIPKGVAHGFLTLTDDCEVAYQMTTPFHAPSSAGVRWDDPAFGIEWPEAIRLISDRDANYPLWQQAAVAIDG